MFTFQILCFVDIKTNWMHIFQSVTLFSCCGVMIFFFRDAKKYVCLTHNVRFGDSYVFLSFNYNEDECYEVCIFPTKTVTK